ncbi:MAG: FAD-dependent oxidoreductase, partial [Pseudomonadales bacterium]
MREPQKIPESYQSLSPTRCDRGKLQNHVSADAVVIGAGVTGNTLAVHLSEAGKSVVQLEASVPGWGGSGRAFGSVVPCHKNSEDAILRYYGEARGNQIIDAYAHGPVLVSELLIRHKIQAEIQGGGWA